MVFSHTGDVAGVAIMPCRHRSDNVCSKMIQIARNTNLYYHDRVLIVSTLLIKYLNYFL